MTTASIRYDADFLDAALCRYWRQHPRSGLLNTLNGAGMALFGAAGIAAFLNQQPLYGTTLLLLAVLLGGSRPFSEWRVRRALHHSPCRGGLLDIGFDDEGLHAMANGEPLHLKWQDFSRVVHFPDGFMLFEGSRHFHWIPATALGPSGVDELRVLVGTYIGRHRVIRG